MMLSNIAERKIVLSQYVGEQRTIKYNSHVPRRGFSVIKRLTLFVPTGAVYLIGNDTCIMHPDDFDKLKGGEEWTKHNQKI